ncbi:hypothetical protein [Kitasatospora sp. NPDC088351]|uniref:hypothetical protein n=1 Tax=Kitasatospora sp. NPDC088351 TaxID=3155180 RepID=UPI00343702D3
MYAMTSRKLGPGGEVAAEVVDDVLAGTVRLPVSLTSLAEQELGPLPGWRDHPWLRYSLALELDERGEAVLGDYRLRYDDLLGLVVSGGRRFGWGWAGTRPAHPQPRERGADLRPTRARKHGHGPSLPVQAAGLRGNSSIHPAASDGWCHHELTQA